MTHDPRRMPRAYARALSALRLAYPEDFEVFRAQYADEDHRVSYRRALIDLKAAHLPEFRERCAQEMKGIDVRKRAPWGQAKRRRVAS